MKVSTSEDFQLQLQKLMVTAFSANASLVLFVVGGFSHANHKLSLDIRHHTKGFRDNKSWSLLARYQVGNRVM